MAGRKIIDSEHNLGTVGGHFPHERDFTGCSDDFKDHSANFASGSTARWRNLLLGSVAASVAMLGYGRAAYAACVTDGTTITCTGDLSAGVTASNPYTTLNVNALTTNITPAADVDGISFISNGDITIVSDTGAFAISASGGDGDGIYADATGAAGTVNINHTGDITSASERGIYTKSAGGSITTVSAGNIQADSDAIFAYVNGAGAASVTHTGDITSTGGQGIYASSISGNVTTASKGNIQTRETGIYAYSAGNGAVNVAHTGDIVTIFEQGIHASSGGGNVMTESAGNIHSSDDGIRAQSTGAGAVSVAHTGDITSTSRGIDAYTHDGSVTTVSTGNIQANNGGIRAYARDSGTSSITHTGDITASFGTGILGHSDTGDVTVVSVGNIQSFGHGIGAATAGAVSVSHTGNINSTLLQGIFAYSSLGDVTTMSNGNIVANEAGIYARSDSSGAVRVTHTGNINSATQQGVFATSGGGGVTVMSHGNIVALDEGITAVDGVAGDVSVTHTGDITSTTSRAIFARSLGGGGVAVTVGDGVVQGLGGAIYATSSTDITLNLNAGSVLIGDIGLYGGAAAVLNTGPSLSISHTFVGTVPTIGDVSGNVAAISGNQIAVADISNLAAADNQLSATLGGVSGVLETSRDRNDRNWWLSAFGGTGISPASGNAPQAVHGFGGLVAGTHALLGNGVQLGVFGGVSKGIHMASVTNGVQTDTNSFFGGLYGSLMTEMLSLDFALSAGGSSNQGTRIVANNTVATGLETALSDSASFFVAPEFTLSSKPIAIQEFSFTPSLRVRYEVLQSGGFTETGLTSGALTMGSATSHALNMRLQGAMPINTGNPAQTLVARLGVDGRFASTSGRDATLLGVAIPAAGAGSEFAGGGFAGLDFSHVLSDFATLTANGELRVGTTGISATANVGVKGAF